MLNVIEVQIDRKESFSIEGNKYGNSERKTISDL